MTPVAHWDLIKADLYREVCGAGGHHLRRRRDPSKVARICRDRLGELEKMRGYRLRPEERSVLLGRATAFLAKLRPEDLSDGRKAPGVARADRQARKDAVLAARRDLEQGGGMPTIDAVRDAVQAVGLKIGRGTVARYLAEAVLRSKRETLERDAARLLELVDGARERESVQGVFPLALVKAYVWDAGRLEEPDDDRRRQLVDLAAEVERFSGATLHVMDEGVILLPQGSALAGIEGGRWCARAKAVRLKARPDLIGPVSPVPDPPAVPLPILAVAATSARQRAARLGPLYGSREAALVTAALNLSPESEWADIRILVQALAPDDERYLRRVVRGAERLRAAADFDISEYCRRAIVYRAERLTERAADVLALLADLANPAPVAGLDDPFPHPATVRARLADFGWPASLDGAARRRAEHLLAVQNVVGHTGLEALQVAEAMGIWSFDPEADDVEQVVRILLGCGRLDPDAQESLARVLLARDEVVVDRQAEADARRRGAAWDQDDEEAEDGARHDREYDDPVESWQHVASTKIRVVSPAAAPWTPYTPAEIEEIERQCWEEECAANATWNPDAEEREREEEDA